LKAAWDATGKSTKEDWQEWMRRFSVTVLTESPNHALRACAALSSIYPPLARELFNSAFVSCWGDLFEPYQVFLSNYPLSPAKLIVRMI
jgi:FKBP12-rapamycin complex-associated protein